MTAPAERSYEITIPYVVYEAMAICYYGGGPRHRTAPNPEAPVTEPTDDDPQPVAEAPAAFDYERLNQELSRNPPLKPVSSFAKKKAGVTAQKPVSSDVGTQETNDASTPGRADQPSDQEA